MIDPVNSNVSVSSTDDSLANGIETCSLLAKMNSGIDIEALLESDTFLQRKVSMTLRKCNLDDRRRLMEAAIKKMKEAANDRINSAWLGSSLKLAAAVVSACCAGASSAASEATGAASTAATSNVAQAVSSAPLGATDGLAISAGHEAAQATLASQAANVDFWKKLGAAAANTTAEGLSRYNPCEYSAAMNDGKAKILDQSNALESESQRSNDDWLNSARELERKMIDRLEQMDRTEHETNLAAMGAR